MKVFSRREYEGLVIGDDISVTVLQIRDGYVRLAISCPRLTPTYWEETLFWSSDEEQSCDLVVSAARS
jgi:carbon storage regulator CsrA